jgi:hypothetical protein
MAAHQFESGGRDVGVELFEALALEDVRALGESAFGRRPQ